MQKRPLRNISTIDFHTHAFPDTLAPHALESISRSGGGAIYYTDGTVSGLRSMMKECSIDISVVLNIATNPRQMKKVNDFAFSINGSDIISFGSVHPDAPDVLNELDRIHDSGLLGVKFHPEFQEFYPDEDKMMPIYKKISALGLITVFHCGYDMCYKSPYRGMPERIIHAKKYLDAPVVAAHWGGISVYDEVLKHIAPVSGIYLDLSMGYGYIPVNTANHIIEKCGVDRLLFGSDSPWHPPIWEKRLINTLDLSEQDKTKIYRDNAIRLLGLSC